MRVLIADDDPVSLRLLQASLEKWGYQPVLARDGVDAWDALESQESPRLAILDWQMPDTDGLELCRRLRNRSNAPYVYTILLTARDKKEDIVEGMEAGADDYVTKPFNSHELQVRLRAGTRILELEAALKSSLSDLEEARKREGAIGARIQQTLLLGRPPTDIDGLQIAALTLPSQQVDGDFYDFYVHDSKCVDLVVGDVMGKGVPAALLSAGIKSHLLRALGRLAGGTSFGSLPSPEEIIKLVHSEVTRDCIGLEFFATLFYARIDVARQAIYFVDCGHTKPLHFHAAGGVCGTLEGENMPLGCSEAEEYRQQTATFEPGDLLLFYSDGITEARNPCGEMFGTARLADLLINLRPANADEIIERVRRAVVAFTGSTTFSDDLTCVAVLAEGISAPAPTIDLETDYLSDLGSLPEIRAFVQRFCENAQAPGDEFTPRLILAVNEVVANVIKHAYHGRRDERIRVTASLSADRIEIRIFHRGEPFDPGGLPIVEPDGSREGGFGRYMIRQCVDVIRYETDEHGTSSILLVKRFEGGTPDGSADG